MQNNGQKPMKRWKSSRGSMKSSSFKNQERVLQELLAVESLVNEIRTNPGNFQDVGVIFQRSDMSEDMVKKSFYDHFHATPDNILRRSRLEAVKRLLLSGELSAEKIGRLLNYESVKSLELDMQATTGMSTSEYRKLRNAKNFAIQLPEEYPVAYLRKALGRDTYSITERLVGDKYDSVIRIGKDAHLISMSIEPRRIDVEIGRMTGSAARIHAVIAGILGLEQNASEFILHVKNLGLQHLVEGRHNLRISQTHSVFDGLLWTIIGQQINIPFACKLKRNLIEKTGQPVADGLFAPPTPESVAALESAELMPLQFSRQKADYVVSVSRLIAEGKLDLDGLKSMSATRAQQTLLAIRGLGPWSVNYLMMRSLGFADCLPLGDTGVTSGLRALFELNEKPDSEKILKLTALFAPFRSLATAHLWQYERKDQK
jgi:AraC family transcriptional regulator, regulatory protein of adaptative response / DNA-3-methyladenine glycosylase II